MNPKSWYFQCFLAFGLVLTLFDSGSVMAQAGASLQVRPTRKFQTFDGMGCGTIFYSGHITSFAERNKDKLQNQLYDELFAEVRTDFLHVMIRPDFEPGNDNNDPYLAEFTEDAFEKNRPAMAVCTAAKERRPGMNIYATLYTPPPWMKTNNAASGGGESKATLKKDLELECAEYIWAYLRHMNDNGLPVEYLSICNESDWKHTQPSYFLTPRQHAQLFGVVAEYLETMESKFPDVPKPKLVAPNGLSAVNAAKNYLPALSSKAAAHVSVIGSHDYDRRPGRWKTLRAMAKKRPVWCTEWCWNGKDNSPELIQSANASWSVMTDAFNEGVNVWMAYDWVYPPRPGGEALTHVDWGNSYQHTKMYHCFRQWCNALTPGMVVVETRMSAPPTPVVSPKSGKTNKLQAGVKACAFYSSNDKRLVIHVVNLQGKESDFSMQVLGSKYAKAAASVFRTSRADSNKAYPNVNLRRGRLTDRLKPHEMVTYVFGSGNSK